jgi:mixed-linked glucan synthase
MAPGDGRRSNVEVVPADGRCAADMDMVGTEGQIGAVNDESWVAADLSGADAEDRPVFRTEKIKGVLLHPYRYTQPRVIE